MSEEEIIEEESKPKITSLEDLPGVGPSTAKKLAENGYSTIAAIAAAAIGELSAIGSLGEKTAQKIIETARDALNLSFESADIVLEKRKQLARISTGSANLDDLFGGGIETGSMTEFYGEFRSGKTQIAHQLCVTAQLPAEQGGLLLDPEKPVKAVYVDTEGTFRPERIVSMAERYEDLDVNEVLKNIQVGRSYNSDHQMALVDKVQQNAAQDNVRLLIVDSLTSHFRAEYIGRGTLATRQQKLNQHIHTLLKVAEVANLAVIATNQVQAKPDVFFGDPNQAVGGNIVAHASQTRVYLRKSKGSRRIARIADSPLLPESEAVFVINEQGIMDP
jgi:DNA repair protein RadA